MVNSSQPPAKSPALWYPKATILKPTLRTEGKYAAGFPRGAVVHYTAGRYGAAEIDLAREMGYVYVVIDEMGNILQASPFDEWGSHAGKSSWPGLEGHVSQYLLGIEIECAGALKADGAGNFKTWWGGQIPQSDVRIVPQQRANQRPGPYHKYTEAQEEALTDLLIWLKKQAPSVFDLDLVLGHDEVAPERKMDPGGSLSMPMPVFRDHLKMVFRAASLGGAPAA
jgi:N-acetyl-anhydromuramyl-L-alanine amidase AmpD